MECSANSVATNDRQCVLMLRDISDSVASARENAFLTTERREIQQQRDELEKWMKLVLHELRTPLSGALGLLQILRRKWEAQPKASDKAALLDEMVRKVAATGDLTPLRQMIDEVYRDSHDHTTDVCTPLIDKAMACTELQLAIVEVRYFL